MVVTPEGTRSRVDKWRMGFYHMALTAQVPIVLGAGDFKKKTIFIGKTIPFTDCRHAQKRALSMKYESITETKTQNILSSGTLISVVSAQ